MSSENLLEALNQGRALRTKIEATDQSGATLPLTGVFLRPDQTLIGSQGETVAPIITVTSRQLVEDIALNRQSNRKDLVACILGIPFLVAAVKIIPYLIPRNITSQAMMEYQILSDTITTVATLGIGIMGITGTIDSGRTVNHLKDLLNFVGTSAFARQHILPSEREVDYQVQDQAES